MTTGTIVKNKNKPRYYKISKDNPAPKVDYIVTIPKQDPNTPNITGAW